MFDTVLPAGVAHWQRSHHAPWWQHTERMVQLYVRCSRSFWLLKHADKFPSLSDGDQLPVDGEESATVVVDLVAELEERLAAEEESKTPSSVE